VCRYKEAAPTVTSGNVNLAVNAEIASDPDVVPVGAAAADFKSHPAGSTGVDAPPSKWNPDFRMQFPASKRDRFLQAVGSKRWSAWIPACDYPSSIYL